MSAGRSVRAGRAAAALRRRQPAASPVLAQANSVGINAAIRNKVEIRGAATKKVKPAVLRARVFLNDEVQTGTASQLQILLLDRTTFTVGANARVTIDRFVYDPAANSRDVGISVARGAFRFMSGRTSASRPVRSRCARRSRPSAYAAPSSRASSARRRTDRRARAGGRQR